MRRWIRGISAIALSSVAVASGLAFPATRGEESPVANRSDEKKAPGGGESDSRVDPCHARKMAALLQTASVRQDVLAEVRAADNTQRDQRIAELERQLREMMQRFELLQQQTSGRGRGVAPPPSRR